MSKAHAAALISSKHDPRHLLAIHLDHGSDDSLGVVQVWVRMYHRELMEPVLINFGFNVMRSKKSAQVRTGMLLHTCSILW